MVPYNKKEDVIEIGEASRLGTSNIYIGGEEKEKQDSYAQLAGMTESKKNRLCGDDPQSRLRTGRVKSPVD